MSYCMYYDEIEPMMTVWVINGSTIVKAKVLDKYQNWPRENIAIRHMESPPYDFIRITDRLNLFKTKEKAIRQIITNEKRKRDYIDKSIKRWEKKLDKEKEKYGS